MVYRVESQAIPLEGPLQLSVRSCVRIMYYVPLLSPTWPGRWHCVDSLHPNTQGGGGPGSHRHLKETDTENKTEQQQCCSEVVGSVILCFLKLCYFNIFMPSECQGLVLESTLSTAHTHM